MHISDGILGPRWILFWFLLSSIFIAAGLGIINKRIRDDPVYLPRISLLGAVVFVISVWHIPVPVTGSSSHPVGTPLAALMIGPFATVVISAIALFFQAFAAHGGLTSIGANVVSMGITGAFSGFFIFTLMKRFFPLWFSAGMAGLAGSIITYLTAALQLALSLNPENVMYYWKLYSMGFIPTQLPLAFGEFALTGYVISYLNKISVFTAVDNGRDEFTKKSISLMFIIIFIIAAGAYAGYLNGGDMAGIDGTVESQAAPDRAPEGIGIKLMARIGEPLGFALVGMTGGLITGYFWDSWRKGK